MTYEVYLDGELIYSPGDVQLALLNPKLELADNRSGSFEFDLPVTNPAYDKIKKMTSVIEVRKDGGGIFYGRCLSIDRDFENMKTVICEGELAELMDSIQEPKEFHDYTVRQFLTHLVNVHNTQTVNTKKFTVGQVTVTDSTTASTATPTGRRRSHASWTSWWTGSAGTSESGTPAATATSTTSRTTATRTRR